jgi:hypothetical protein
MNWNKYKPYFTKEEFDCKCGCGKNNMTKKQMDMLLKARIEANIPFIINSGCRCDTHNIYVGGDEFSEHLKGKGTDIKCTSSTHRWKIINALLKAGFKRIGIATNYIHVGTSSKKPQEVIWKY